MLGLSRTMTGGLEDEAALASNRVLDYTTVLNRISEQNSWRCGFAAFRVDNDFRRYRKPRISQTTHLFN
jgi:hypothetical protein